VQGSVKRALEQTTLAELVAFAERGPAATRPPRRSRGAQKRAPALQV
jgi:hypothetical protein